ncbi:MAG: hypothetical protein ACXWRE_17135 [Pseudobdellovibrionaceae bacterium]
MMLYKLLKFSFLLSILMTSYGLTVRAECVFNPEIQQVKYHANLNAQQIDQLVHLAHKENAAKGWQLLSSWGDSYAAMAAKVLSVKKPKAGSFYKKLITTHWIQAVGSEKYRKNFYPVAKQHFRQYVEILRSTGNWPDSDQILMSYVKSARDHHLPDITVFDAAWDAAGMNKVRSWQELSHIERERLVYPTNVCLDINPHEVRRLIRNDLLAAPLLYASKSFL